MFSYAGKVIVFTLIALCAVNFIGKRVLQVLEVPLVDKNLQTQTMEAPTHDKGHSIEFDPFTGKQHSI